MTVDVLQSTWPFLAGIAFLAGLCVLVVLGAGHRQAIELHDRLIASHEMRRRYLERDQTDRAASSSDRTPTGGA